MGRGRSLYERREMHRKCKSEVLKGRDHLGDLDVDLKVILKWILKKYDMKVWTALLWLTQPPIQLVPGTLFLGVRRPGREADHSPPCRAEVR
jgi:hypothetical protein